MTARAVVAALSKRGWRVTTAESCTGGLLAGAITDIAGSSAVFERGVITYSDAAKIDLLGVSARTLQDHGAVSEEVAAEMVRGAARLSGAEIAVSITGIAGPGGSDFKPEGRVCFGLSSPQGVRTETVEFGPPGRSIVRAKSVDHALGLILSAMC